MGFGDEKEQKRFNPQKIREEARRKEGYSEGKIQPYLLKPFVHPLVLLHFHPPVMG